MCERVWRPQNSDRCVRTRVKEGYRSTQGEGQSEQEKGSFKIRIEREQGEHKKRGRSFTAHSLDMLYIDMEDNTVH